MSVSSVDRSLPDEVTRFFAADHPEALQDPYPLYARMRAESPALQIGADVYVVTRYGDVKAARLDRQIVSPDERLSKLDGRFSRLSEDDLDAYTEIADFERLMISRHDGDAHREYRRALVRAFTPRRMAEWPDRLQTVIDLEIQALPQDEVVDLIAFAYRVPLLAIMALVGAPVDDADDVKHWGDSLIDAIMRVPLDPQLLQLGRRRLREYHEYADALLARHRADTDDRTSVVSLLLEAEESEVLPRAKIIATLMHFLFAGHETTTNMIANGMLRLLEHRDQWDLLCSDPERFASGSVEESLRYEAPSQFSARAAAGEVEIGGVTIARDASIVLGTGPANRDPDMFPEPDRFDITRSPNDHMGLGLGRHFCLGAPLARMEGRLAFATLARRFPDVELAVPADELAWIRRPRLRGLERLPVRLGRDHG